MFSPRCKSPANNIIFSLLKTHSKYAFKIHSLFAVLFGLLKRLTTHKLKDYKQDGFNKQRLS